MTECPNCNAAQTYRKNPTDLRIYCNCCGHSWTTNQTQRPLIEKSFWKSEGSLKGKHYIDIWLCPNNTTKYSFALRYGASLSVCWNEYSENPYVKGCFENPEEAIAAATEEIYSEDEL